MCDNGPFSHHSEHSEPTRRLKARSGAYLGKQSGRKIKFPFVTRLIKLSGNISLSDVYNQQSTDAYNNLIEFKNEF